MIFRKLTLKKMGIVLIVVGLISVVAAGGLWLYNDVEDNEAAEYSETTVQVLFEHIALLDEEDDLDVSPVETEDAPPPSNSGDDDVEIGIQEDPEEGSFGYMRVNGNQYLGIIRIPTLGLRLPINSEWSFPSLRYTPCRFSGTIENRNIVIAGHAYRAHFRDIPNLTIGEVIEIIAVDGTRYTYQVAKTQVVQPSETYVVVNSDYDLTLFTCTYNGTARAVVRAMLVGDSSQTPHEEA